MSGVTVLGNPAEVYNYGTLFWWTGNISKISLKRETDRKNVQTDNMKK